MNALETVGFSPENLWRLFAVWPAGQRSQARGPFTSKKSLRDIWMGTPFYIGKISRIESVWPHLMKEVWLLLMEEICQGSILKKTMSLLCVPEQELFLFKF